MTTLKKTISAFTLSLSMALGTPAFAENRSIISSEADLLTVVNVLTPDEGQQNSVVKSLQEGMTNTMRHRDGFISATIHRSLDSEHVLVYAQWKSAEHLGEAVKLIEAGKAPSMANVFTIARPAYHPYEVVSVHVNGGGKAPH